VSNKAVAAAGAVAKRASPYYYLVVEIVCGEFVVAVSRCVALCAQAIRMRSSWADACQNARTPEGWTVDELRRVVARNDDLRNPPQAPLFMRRIRTHTLQFVVRWRQLIAQRRAWL